MIYRFLADALVVFHLCFVIFVMAGGIAALKWRRVMWFHLPAVAWGIFIELSHGLCPLTPLENQLRAWGGRNRYQGGFVDHYVMPVLYPDGLTERIQVAIAIFIIAVNLICYVGVVYLWRRRRKLARPSNGETVGVTAIAGETGAVIARREFPDGAAETRVPQAAK